MILGGALIFYKRFLEVPEFHLGDVLIKIYWGFNGNIVITFCFQGSF